MKKSNLKKQENQGFLDCRSLPYHLDEKGISVSALEEQCGLLKGTFDDVCSGRKHKMPREIVEKAAKILHVDTESLGKLPCHNIRHYCNQRGLSCSALEIACGFEKNTLWDAYNGGNKNMTYEKIKKVADVLHVSIQDLGAPEKECVDIHKITENIQRSLKKVAPVWLRKAKADRITAFLSQTEATDDLIENVVYLLIDSNLLGRSLACFLLSPYDDLEDFLDALTPGFKHPFPTSDPASYIADYFLTPNRRKKDKKRITRTDAAETLPLSRPTLDKLIRGEAIKNRTIFENKLISMIVENETTEIEEETDNEIARQIRQAIAKSYPGFLNEAGNLFLGYYLNTNDIYLEFLLKRLLDSSSSPPDPQTIQVLEDITKCPQFYQKHYKPNIHIHYCQEEPESYYVSILFDKKILDKNLSDQELFNKILSVRKLVQDILSNQELLDILLSDKTIFDKIVPALSQDLSVRTFLYDVLSNHNLLKQIPSNPFLLWKALLDHFLLEGTIYSFFLLPSPFLYLPLPDPDAVPKISVDSPYQIDLDLSPDDDDFESQMLELALHAFIDDVVVPMSPTLLANAFYDYLDECYADAVITGDTIHDFELSCSSRSRQRYQQYRQIVAKIRDETDSEDLDSFMDTIAKIFSRMREDSAYEGQVLREYGLERESKNNT